jgi:hypothetical protein
MTTIHTTTNKHISQKQRITLFVKPAIVKQARAQAILEEITLTALVERALIKYLPQATVIPKLEDAV